MLCRLETLSAIQNLERNLEGDQVLLAQMQVLLSKWESDPIFSACPSAPMIVPKPIKEHMPAGHINNAQLPENMPTDTRAALTSNSNLIAPSITALLKAIHDARIFSIC
jgi:hypothetical protein